MDKIFSSILCCTFGTRAEHKLATSSTSSTTRITSESNKKTAPKLEENTDGYHEQEVSVNIDKDANAQTIVLQPLGNDLADESNGGKDADNRASETEEAGVTDEKPSNSLQLDSDDYEYEFDLTTMQPDQTVSKSGWLLEGPGDDVKGRKCLVLDLDETLVHSSFKYLRTADFVIPVEIEGQTHNVYVIKRPGVDQFMKRVGELYEVVVFTASVSRYGDPLLDELDVHKSIHHRLFRDSCYNYQGNYIKNLSQIGRPLKDLIIIDNSPASYIFHPQHAVPISSWFSDAHDNELLDLLPFLEDLAGQEVDDIGLVLDITTT